MTPEQRSLIRDAVRQRYRSVAQGAAGLFRYPTGRQGALLLGYDSELVNSLPEQVLCSFCGVGNPFSVGPVTPGATLLDIGCGSGFDVIVAARLAGPQGRVRGVDISPEMLTQARRNIAATGTTTAEVVCLDDEFLPYEDGLFDLVIANGVFNLSPAKRSLFHEVYRVLRPGGRLQFADIVLRQGARSSPFADAKSWAH